MNTEIKKPAQLFIMEASATRKLFGEASDEKKRAHAKRVIDWHKQVRYNKLRHLIEKLRG